MFIYQKIILSRKKIIKEINFGIDIIQGNAKMNNIDNEYKIILLIFFASFFDFSQFTILLTIPEIAILSPTSDQRLCIIITISSSLLYTFALRNKTGKHHNYSLIGMGICCFIIIVFELIFKYKGVNFGNFILAYLLVICRLIFIGYTDTIEKYLVEYNFVNMFLVLAGEGIFGVILCIICAVVIKKNPIQR